MTITVFTACNKDDNNNTQPLVDISFVAVLMNYELETTQATLDIMDVTVEYYDADGKIKSEPMKEKKWKKSIQHNLPATVGVHMKVQMKDGFDVENSEAVEISFTNDYSGYLIGATGSKTVLPNTSRGTTGTNTKSKGFSDFFAKNSNNILSELYFIDAKGQCTYGVWE